MGFFDKLLGRRDKGTAPDPFVGDDRQPDPGDSELDQAEERASEARDEQVGIENRVPPGTG
ncbi:MAG TPA: hypothetical protein VFG85_10665 [Gaiellaceae bacterium]|jgi:hypothetical protein|nr:hypothetical protein [Gaiellaceae bacterium]